MSGVKFAASAIAAGITAALAAKNPEELSTLMDATFKGGPGNDPETIMQWTGYRDAMFGIGVAQFGQKWCDHFDAKFEKEHPEQAAMLDALAGLTSAMGKHHHSHHLH